jgi:predicted secreted protein with PEFG-CTERM motif
MYAKTALVLTIIIALAFSSLNTDGLITIRAPLAFGAQVQKFTAKLTGQNEVPPTNTKATGSLEMELSPDGTISHYMLNVTNISNVISSQIHEGANGTNGPVIVTLFKSLRNGKMINRTLSQGTLYSDLFEGTFAGKHLSDLIILINDGKAYVNINTKQNPLGEIRGEMSGVTFATVPEFGSTATPIFAIALIGIIIASTKFINKNKL